jgi:enoyl-CoA hydratase
VTELSDSYNTLILEKSHRIATITLNRPERLNAINAVMRSEIALACDEIASDSSVSVVILKGKGRAFTSGLDINKNDRGPNLHPGDTAADWANIHRKQDFLWKIWDLPKPVIAQVHGYALGLGSVLMTVCDLVVVTHDARIGNARTLMGAGVEGPKFVWSVGLRRAKWLDFLPGWRITGDEAVEWGWANLAVDADEIDDEVNALAAQIAVMPLSHLMLRKASLNRVWEQLAFRSSVMAASDLDAVAHKSDDGVMMEAESASGGFIALGAELCREYPARHGRD